MSLVLSEEELVARLESTLEIVAEEVKNTQYWDRNREPGWSGGAQLYDSQKSVETWLLWIEECLAQARSAAFESSDKQDALHYLLTAATLAVTCLMHNPPPRRE